MFAKTAGRQLRPANLTTLARSFSSTAPARVDFTNVVIGGGVVGLATARALAEQAVDSSSSNTTLLLERHSQVGTETSSRNSEVIHAGLYYGADSLKTRLCVAGRRQLYAFCGARGVAHARVGKWVVAQDGAQREALERIHGFARAYDGGAGAAIPTRWVADAEARRLEPDVAARAGVLESPDTGIVDSHGLMAALHGLFEDAGGVTALRSAVVAVEPLGGETANSLPGSAGWRLTVRDTATGAESAVTASNLINSAGLGAAAVHNLIAPAERHRRLYYAKGTYFSYGSSRPRPPSRLVYPVTAPGAGGLGTHLTLDLAGRMRFGPDVEWVDAPDDVAATAARLPAAVAEIRRYMPGVDAAALAPDYAGVRPKLARAGAVGATGGPGFVDFYVRREEGFEGWVNLLGIESPGLTSCLAIADLVRDMLYGSRPVEESPAA
ncbi:FAD dependent oxidoreductase [Hypoxylon sp. FL1284]|nr:FAD dependent oxidoreductase [Hypoxylon sp. FL1284]